MNLKPLMTHEIGSIAKPHWRVKAMTDAELRDEDLEEAKVWGEKLLIPEIEKLLKILSKRSQFTEAEKDTILFYSSLFVIKFLESTGLDLIWDGEQHRIEMYEYPIKHIEGFKFHGHVRSFDNKYYRKASCEGPIACPKPYHLEEWKQIKKMATREIKIPITGAYTLVDWSYDAFYSKTAAPGVDDINQRRLNAREQFLSDVARHIIYPNLKALYEAGAQYLQIDEPAAATKQHETGHFIRSVKDSIADLAGKVFFSIHICYSVYSRLFPQIKELEGILNEIHLEYANRDSCALGTKSSDRPGYEILKNFRNTNFVVGLGVVDIHTDFIEPPELIRDRILHACDVLQDPTKIMVAPDCGLRTRRWEVSHQKLINMVAGKNMALRELGLL